MKTKSATTTFSTSCPTTTFQTYRQGFTLLEIVISIAIIALVSTVIVVSTLQYREKKVLEEATEAVVVALATARTQTVAGLDDSVYGVRISTDEVIVFKGDSYSASDSDNDTVFTSDDVTFSTVLSGGGSSVVFERLSGETEDVGTVTVRLVSDSTKENIVTIKKSGIASF